MSFSCESIFCLLLAMFEWKEPTVDDCSFSLSYLSVLRYNFVWVQVSHGNISLNGEHFKLIIDFNAGGLWAFIKFVKIILGCILTDLDVIVALKKELWRLITSIMKIYSIWSDGCTLQVKPSIDANLYCDSLLWGINIHTGNFP